MTEKHKSTLSYVNLTEDKLQLARTNPHCLEYFITRDNIHDCTECTGKLFTKMGLKSNQLFEKDLKYLKNNMNQDSHDNKCSKCITSSFLFYSKEDPYDNNKKYMKNELDNFKNIDNFKKSELIYKYDDIPYLLNYEKTYPLPTTVVHWGQLKMFLTTFLFLIKVVKDDDKIVNIVYPGSARGDNILILCDLFPNTRWYLIDPNKFHLSLYKHKQIIECRNELFTDDLASYYFDILKDTKLLFISDIRLATDDINIIEDQNMNARWYSIIKPSYAFLKFRCPYNKPEKYSYYKGKIYLQPYAPIKSTETRILLAGVLEKETYDIDEYIGRMFYFNRVIRPSFYKTLYKTSDENNYMDHCWDCSYFSYIVNNYITNFPTINPYKKYDISEFINKIIEIISKTNINRLKENTLHIRERLFD